MLEALKESVWKANLQLVEYGLVTLTWGNVSAIDRENALVVIKPSGVAYDEMKPEHMVVVDLDGKVVEGALRPSSDTPTHLELYRAFSSVGGIAHTHSAWACAWAQAGRSIPVYGTTHADFSPCAVPCARSLTEEEVQSAYELNTGRVIAETFEQNALSPDACPAALVHRHGPFTWGATPDAAVQNALILEQIAKMAYRTEAVAAFSADTNIGIEPYLCDKHYQRKHGKNAYYGQK